MILTYIVYEYTRTRSAFFLLYERERREKRGEKKREERKERREKKRGEKKKNAPDNNKRSRLSISLNNTGV